MQVCQICNMINLQGICYDEKSSFLRGPAKAPPLIRTHLHSESSNSFSESGIDISKIDIKDHGDFNVREYFDIEEITKASISEGGPLISLGGDHSVSYPIVKALNEQIGDFEILHLDAHGDLYEDFEGDRYSHACPFARIMEGGHCKKLTQVGIRTMTPQQRATADKYSVRVIEMKDYNIEKIGSFNYPLYLSIDIDALDPAFAPGVSHHEPGGFSSRQVLDLLLSLNAKVIGADIVEYNPDRDINGMTGMLSAKILKEVIALINK